MSNNDNNYDRYSEPYYDEYGSQSAAAYYDETPTNYYTAEVDHRARNSHQNNNSR